jgi:hypothetical protein
MLHNLDGSCYIKLARPERQRGLTKIPLYHLIVQSMAPAKLQVWPVDIHTDEARTSPVDAAQRADDPAPTAHIQ